MIPEREPEKWLPHLRMAAGAQITQCRFGEVVTRNNSAKRLLCDCNGQKINVFVINNWRASLVPAAAVIPAPIVYIKVAAVKKLVVGFRWCPGKARRKAWLVGRFLALGNGPLALRLGDHRSQSFTLKKLECSKQA